MSITNSRELVIAASRAPVDHVYFIGPYGARVSFASQQRRALNLIWALRQTPSAWPKAPQPRAAVIGGGIAGVMVAAALRLQGCSVWVYEAKSSHLNLQVDAYHRFAHPSINFWPEQALSWTTKFPFLDWYAASCDEIIKAIDRQWSTHFRKKIAYVNPNWTFIGFEAGENQNKGKVLLKFKGHEDQIVDMAFITTGFGSEQNLGDPNYTSYWDPDKFNTMSLEIRKKYVVSGTGDGGVIDTLRLTYTKFMDDDIALQFLNLCDSGGLRERVSNIEKAAEALAPQERSVHYHNEYTDVARDQDQGAKDLLHPLIPDKNPIFLVGRRPHPYDIGTAPVHKMILALSIDLKRVTYVQGSVHRYEEKYWLRRDGQPDEDLAADFVLARHGAIPPINGFVTPEARQKLEEIQRQLGDYLDIPEYKENAHFDTTIVPGRTTDPSSFVDLRSELAQDFLRSRFKLACRTILNAPEPHFQAVDDRPAHRATESPFGPLPDELFGIRLLKPNGRSGPIDDLVGRSPE